MATHQKRKVFMKSLFIIGIVLLAAPAGAFDLKGLELGKPATDEQIKAATGIVCQVYCTGLVMLAGRLIDTTISRDKDLNITAISAEFDNAQFDLLDAAFTVKYGKPVETKIPVSNGFGAQFVQIQHEWTQNGQAILLGKYVSATEGVLQMVSADEAARRAAKAKKSANDI